MTSPRFNFRLFPAILLAVLGSAGCGGSKLTSAEGKTFLQWVGPVLEHAAYLLQDTNQAGRRVTFQSSDVISRNVSAAVSEWSVGKNGITYIAEQSANDFVRVISIVPADEQIGRAMAQIRKRIESSDPNQQSDLIEMAKGAVAVMNLTSNESGRRTIAQITSIAREMGYGTAQGGVLPGTKLGMILHRGKPSPNGVPMTDEDSGGYVGIYSSKSNLVSVDLILFAYGGRVQALWQSPTFNGTGADGNRERKKP